MRTRRGGPLVLLPGLLLPLLAGAACGGYRWVRADAGLGEVRRVAVETLRNDSFEPGLEIIVTDALLQELARGGGVEVVRDTGHADLVLSGAVLPLNVRPRTLSPATLSLEYEVELRIDLTATRPDGSVLAFDPSALREWELFLSSADLEAARKNREEAVRRLAGVLATRVHEALSARLVR